MEGKAREALPENVNTIDSIKTALRNKIKPKVVEGITKVKAHEMTVEQTVSVCRLNAKSSLVKSILASTAFSDPKDVEISRRTNKRVK